MNTNLLNMIDTVLGDTKGKDAPKASKRAKAPNKSIGPAQLLKAKNEKLASKGIDVSKIDGKFKGSKDNIKTVAEAVNARYGEKATQEYLAGIKTEDPANYTVRSFYGWLQSGLSPAKGEKAFCRIKKVNGGTQAMFHLEQVTDKAAKSIVKAEPTVEDRMNTLEAGMAKILEALSK